MSSNKTFSFSRFNLLLRQDFFINKNRYLLLTLVSFLLLYLVQVWAMWIDAGYRHMNTFTAGNYEGTFFTCMLGLAFFVGFAFPNLENKVKQSQYLLLPASTLEKFTLQFLIRIVLGLCLFLLFFWIDAYLAKWTALSLTKATDRLLEVVDFHFSYIMHGVETFFDRLTIWAMILTVEFYLFSSRLYFKRNALLKTIIGFFILCFLAVCIMVLLSHLFFPETTGFDIYRESFDLTPHMQNTQLWTYLIVDLSWLFLLPISYFRLKEKQL
jgi:hypothetical protein